VYPSLPCPESETEGNPILELVPKGEERKRLLVLAARSGPPVKNQTAIKNNKTTNIKMTSFRPPVPPSSAMAQF
jgi:hypothetical protein